MADWVVLAVVEECFDDGEFATLRPRERQLAPEPVRDRGGELGRQRVRADSIADGP